MATWTGKTLGKVVIGELLARGGMAEVYLGEHGTLNRKVAIKIMRDHLDADPDNHLRFEREARVVANLRHPNIIQVFDYELVDGQPCMIMELVQGASLGEYLKALHKRGEKLPYETIIKILSKIAEAVDYAHQQHLIHRDIKPANVLLRSASGPIDPAKPLPEDTEPILTDFGLVRVSDSSVQTSTGTVSGTPAYMSPEQARGDKVDYKTDLYALGVILYEMLVGAVPFDAESTFGILMKHLNDPPPPIFGISPELQAIIDRSLSKNPEFRYNTAKELTDEFAAVFNGQAISSTTASLAKASQKFNSKSKQPRSFSWLMIGVGALLIIGIAIISLRFLRPIPPGENQVVGGVSYLDQNAWVDKATISLANLPPPKDGTHYDIWFLSQGGETRFKAGSVKSNDSAQMQLAYVDKNQENLLSLFDQIEITIEADNDSNPDESSGNIAASSIFPPFALVHVRHLLVSFPSAPEQIALIQGLWGAVDDVDNNTRALQEAFNNGDEELTRKKIEEIINEIAGNANKDQYRDWNKDGTIDDIGDGFGLLQNGEPGYTDQGYISQTESHATYAAQSTDATENIQTHSIQVALCLENIKGWSEQLLQKALQLQEMPFGADMQPLIEEMALLANQITLGTDSNGNGIIEPIAGEGGATTAYEHVYYMADMPLLPGAHRIPAPALTPVK